MVEYFVWGSRKGKTFQRKVKSKKHALKEKSKAKAMGYEAHYRRVDRPVPQKSKSKRRKK